MKNLFKYMLMDKAGEADGGGGTGGSLLTGSNGGGTGNAPQGGTGNGNPPDPKAAPAGNGTPGGAPAGNPPQDWRSTLPSELREDPALKVIQDVGALAKSYISAQKMVGADKIVIPGKHATAEDVRAVYEKLGLPKEIKDYEVKIKDGMGIDKEFANKFKEAAFKAGVFPPQAQALADWFSEINAGSAAEVEKQVKADRAAKIEALKGEWGNAFQKKVNDAAQVIREAGLPDELLKFLDTSGFGDDPNVLKLFSHIKDKFLKEDSAANGGQTGIPGALTPGEAQKAYNTILGDFKHPYYVADHPNHKAAVDEMSGLFAQAFPSAKK